MDAFAALTACGPAPHPRAAVLAVSARALGEAAVPHLWTDAVVHTVAAVLEARNATAAAWLRRECTAPPQPIPQSLPLPLENGDDETQRVVWTALGPALAAATAAIKQALQEESKGGHHQAQEAVAQTFARHAVLAFLAVALAAAPGTRFSVPDRGQRYDRGFHDAGMSLEDGAAGDIVLTAFPGVVYDDPVLMRTVPVFRAVVWCTPSPS
ncbi:hypothetical protein BC828DRAFT_385944 [Blastocladiella britannica]|nr:hypothetical protein BC828DRAFT_385944 [Blastocladiella britannica]